MQDGLSNDVLMNSNANQMSNNDYNADNDFNNELNLWNTIAHQSLLLDNITGLGYGTQGNAFLNENQHNLLRNRILPFNMNHALCQNNNSKSLLDNLKSFDSKDTFVFPEKKIRVLPKIPDKVLDAPDLSGDFYYNLIDWSQKNVLSVVLDSSVYLWNAETGQNYILTESEERICSINWMNSGTCLAIGLESGAVQLWDTIKNELLRTMHGHTDRVSALSWNDYIISSGSRDSKIFNHDVRVQSHIVSTYLGHKYEVCGLKWSPDGEQLASGGGDNKICIWDVNKSSNINPLLYEIDHDFGINNAEAGNVFNTFENNNNTSSSVNDFIRANSNDSGSGQRNNYLSTHIARLKELGNYCILIF